MLKHATTLTRTHASERLRHRGRCLARKRGYLRSQALARGLLVPEPAYWDPDSLARSAGGPALLSYTSPTLEHDRLCRLDYPRPIMSLTGGTSGKVYWSRSRLGGWWCRPLALVPPVPLHPDPPDTPRR